MHSAKVSAQFRVTWHVSTLSQAFRAEKASWRAVIQLNVVQSIHTILDLVSRAHATSNDILPPPSIALGHDYTSSITSFTPPSPTSSVLKEYPILPPELLKLKMRLAPLIQVEATLIRKLVPPEQADILARGSKRIPVPRN